MIHCLVIEDELGMIDPLLFYLSKGEENLEFTLYCPNADNRQSMEKKISEELKWKPDVILLDLMMPDKPGGRLTDLGGIEFLKQLRKGNYSKIHFKTPVVVLSAYEGIQAFKQEYQEMVFDVFTKPADIFAVAESLHKAGSNFQKEKNE